MGIGIFDESMVEAVIDLPDRCLKPGGRILPAKFEFYLEPMQLLERSKFPDSGAATARGDIYANAGRAQW